MSESDKVVTSDFSKKKTEFENSLKQRNFEIDLFWKRSWFFGALILAEIAGFYKLKTDLNPAFPPVTLAFITSITTLAQCLMNRGSKFWQERWEYITMNREAALGIELTKLKYFKDEALNNWLNEHYEITLANEWFFIDASILSKGDNHFTKSYRYSVSKITFLVWDIIFICSLLCWINESLLLFSTKPDWSFTVKLSILYIITIGYIFLFWIKGKVHEPFDKNLINMKKKNFEVIKKINEMYVKNDIDSSFIKDMK